MNHGLQAKAPPARPPPRLHPQDALTRHRNWKNQLLQPFGTIVTETRVGHGPHPDSVDEARFMARMILQRIERRLLRRLTGV